MKQRIVIFVTTICSVVFLCVAIRQCGSPKAIEIITATDKSVYRQKDRQLDESHSGKKSPAQVQISQKPEEMLNRYNAGASGFDSKVQFWGKVLDQDGHPIQGASIRASVTTLRMIKTEKGYREFELLDVQSKADGTFMFDGAAGFSLTIEKLTKPGYVLPSVYQQAMRFREDFKHRFIYNPMGGPEKAFAL